MQNTNSTITRETITKSMRLFIKRNNTNKENIKVDEKGKLKDKKNRKSTDDIIH